MYNYCYHNSDVLKNKKHIKNFKDWQTAERLYSQKRQEELDRHPIAGNFDLQHLQKIHRYLFQDMYVWAGNIRLNNIVKNEDVFCPSDNILEEADVIFKNLWTEELFIGNDSYQLPEKFASLTNELNRLHPFREGNGRTIRIFLDSLAKINGYRLNLEPVSSDEWNDASRTGFRYNDISQFKIIFEMSLTPVSQNTEMNFLKNMPETVQNLHNELRPVVRNVQTTEKLSNGRELPHIEDQHYSDTEDEI